MATTIRRESSYLCSHRLLQAGLQRCGCRCRVLRRGKLLVSPPQAPAVILGLLLLQHMLACSGHPSASNDAATQPLRQAGNTAGRHAAVLECTLLMLRAHAPRMLSARRLTTAHIRERKPRSIGQPHREASNRCSEHQHTHPTATSGLHLTTRLHHR
jgi:hypothetical protein